MIVENDFKLSNDETMRRLRTIAQAPGELQWRLELLETMSRMRVNQEIANRGIVQMMGRIRKDVSHLTPTKLAELMNAQIEQKMAPRDKDVSRLWKAAIWLLEKVSTIGIGAFFAYLAIRH